jgi:hypothetical protein
MASKTNSEFLIHIALRIMQEDDSVFALLEESIDRFTMQDMQFIFNALNMWCISDKPSLAENLKDFFKLMTSTELYRTDFRADALINTSLALIENSIELDKLNKLKDTLTN